MKTAIDRSVGEAELLARRGEFDGRPAVGRGVRRASPSARTRCSTTATRVGRSPRCLRAAGDADGAKGAEDRALALFERKGATALLDRPQEAASQVHLPSESDEPSSLENRCVRLSREFHDALGRSDFDRAAGMYADAFTIEDRRSGLRDTIAGKAANLEHLRAMLSGAAFDISWRVVATRGERLALFLQRWDVRTSPDAEAFVAELLSLGEIDEDDRFIRIVQFESDQLDAAFAELDERYAASEPFNLIELGARIIRVMNDRDWGAYRQLLNDGLKMVDHRPVSLGEFVGADNQVKAVRELAEIVPDLRFYITAVQAIEGYACSRT